MNRVKILLISMIFIVALLQVVILNRDSTSGENLVKIHKETEKAEKENIKLSQQIASASSLTTISQRAKLYGFISSQKIVSLSSPPKLAYTNENNY